MTAYIYSTLATDNEYVLWSAPQGARAAAQKRRSVKVHGGSNVARQNHSKGIFTPKGFVTTVSDEDLEWLEKDYLFCLHMKNGFIKVDKSSKDFKDDTEKFHDAVKKQRLDMMSDAPADMNMNDAGIQKNEQTLPTKKKKKLDDE